MSNFVEQSTNQNFNYPLIYPDNYDFIKFIPEESIPDFLKNYNNDTLTPENNKTIKDIKDNIKKSITNINQEPFNRITYLYSYEKYELYENNILYSFEEYHIIQSYILDSYTNNVDFNEIYDLLSYCIIKLDDIKKHEKEFHEIRNLDEEIKNNISYVYFLIVKLIILNIAYLINRLDINDKNIIYGLKSEISDFFILKYDINNNGNIEDDKDDINELIKQYYDSNIDNIDVNIKYTLTCIQNVHNIIDYNIDINNYGYEIIKNTNISCNINNEYISIYDMSTYVSICNKFNKLDNIFVEINNFIVDEKFKIFYYVEPIIDPLISFIFENIDCKDYKDVYANILNQKFNSKEPITLYNTTNHVNDIVQICENFLESTSSEGEINVIFNIILLSLLEIIKSSLNIVNDKLYDETCLLSPYFFGSHDNNIISKIRKFIRSNDTSVPNYVKVLYEKSEDDKEGNKLENNLWSQKQSNIEKWSDELKNYMKTKITDINDLINTYSNLFNSFVTLYPTLIAYIILFGVIDKWYVIHRIEIIESPNNIYYCILETLLNDYNLKDKIDISKLDVKFKKCENDFTHLCSLFSKLNLIFEPKLNNDTSIKLVGFDNINNHEFKNNNKNFSKISDIFSKFNINIRNVSVNTLDKYSDILNSINNKFFNHTNYNINVNTLDGINSKYKSLTKNIVKYDQLKKTYPTLDILVINEMKKLLNVYNDINVTNNANKLDYGSLDFIYHIFGYKTINNNNIINTNNINNNIKVIMNQNNYIRPINPTNYVTSSNTTNMQQQTSFPIKSSKNQDIKSISNFNPVEIEDLLPTKTKYNIPTGDVDLLLTKYQNDKKKNNSNSHILVNNNIKLINMLLLKNIEFFKLDYDNLEKNKDGLNTQVTNYSKSIIEYQSFDKIKYNFYRLSHDNYSLLKDKDYQSIFKDINEYQYRKIVVNSILDYFKSKEKQNVYKLDNSSIANMCIKFIASIYYYYNNKENTEKKSQLENTIEFNKKAIYDNINKVFSEFFKEYTDKINIINNIININIFIDNKCRNIIIDDIFFLNINYILETLKTNIHYLDNIKNIVDTIPKYKINLEPILYNDYVNNIKQKLDINDNNNFTVNSLITYVIEISKDYLEYQCLIFNLLHFMDEVETFAVFNYKKPIDNTTIVNTVKNGVSNDMIDYIDPVKLKDISIMINETDRGIINEYIEGINSKNISKNKSIINVTLYIKHIISNILGNTESNDVIDEYKLDDYRNKALKYLFNITIEQNDSNGSLNLPTSPEGVLKFIPNITTNIYNKITAFIKNPIKAIATADQPSNKNKVLYIDMYCLIRFINNMRDTGLKANKENINKILNNIKDETDKINDVFKKSCNTFLKHISLYINKHCQYITSIKKLGINDEQLSILAFKIIGFNAIITILTNIINVPNIVDQILFISEIMKSFLITIHEINIIVEYFNIITTSFKSRDMHIIYSQIQFNYIHTYKNITKILVQSLKIIDKVEYNANARIENINNIFTDLHEKINIDIIEKLDKALIDLNEDINKNSINSDQAFSVIKFEYNKLYDISSVYKNFILSYIKNTYDSSNSSNSELTNYNIDKSDDIFMFVVLNLSTNIENIHKKLTTLFRGKIGVKEFQIGDTDIYEKIEDLKRRLKEYGETNPMYLIYLNEYGNRLNKLKSLNLSKDDIARENTLFSSVKAEIDNTKLFSQDNLFKKNGFFTFTSFANSISNSQLSKRLTDMLNKRTNKVPFMYIHLKLHSKILTHLFIHITDENIINDFFNFNIFILNANINSKNIELVNNLKEINISSKTDYDTHIGSFFIYHFLKSDHFEYLDINELFNIIIDRTFYQMIDPILQSIIDIFYSNTQYNIQTLKLEIEKSLNSKKNNNSSAIPTFNNSNDEKNILQEILFFLITLTMLTYYKNKTINQVYDDNFKKITIFDNSGNITEEFKQNLQKIIKDIDYDLTKKIEQHMALTVIDFNPTPDCSDSINDNVFLTEALDLYF